MPASQSKTILRRDALARRISAGPPLALGFAQSLAERGSAFAQQTAAGFDPSRFTVAAYWPVGAEADTRPLLTALAEHGFAVALPVTVARAEPLVFRLWRRGDRLGRGQMGIGEPPPDAPAVEPGLLFVPLLAFDRRGNRIGYGAGHYDQTLAGLRKLKPVIAVGVAFAFQEIEAVPSEPHDQRLDFVLTDQEWVDCRGDNRA